MALLAFLLGCYWFFVTWRIQQGLLASDGLPKLENISHDSLDSTLVTIVIAARNEAERIGETVRRLAAQESLCFELIVVDDRSTDDTANIVQQIADTDQRVRLVQVDALPDGWLGKCNACWQGALKANGDWLLFTDGDAHMSCDLVARAVATAKVEQASHLALLPYVIASSFWTRAALIGQMQLFTLYTSPHTINSDRSSRWIGVGAFNLFERSAYLAIGGHRAVRMEVVEDMKLGYLVRKNHYRQRAYSGIGDLQVDWAKSVAGILAATEKNWFAAIDYRLWTAAAFFLLVPSTVVLPVVAAVLAGSTGWFALAGLMSLTIPGYFLARQFGWPATIAPLCPFGWLVFTAAGVNSVWKTLSNGGIRWRDRFYPLDALRKGVVR